MPFLAGELTLVVPFLMMPLPQNPYPSGLSWSDPPRPRHLGPLAAALTNPMDSGAPKHRVYGAVAQFGAWGAETEIVKCSSSVQTETHLSNSLSPEAPGNLEALVTSGFIQDSR